MIAAQLAEWGGAALPLERLAFGTNEPDAIADAVDTWCRAHLGAAIDHYLFFDSSSGSVHGLHLADGRDVVVKVHRPGLTFAYLAASHRAQQALVGHGMPGPEPLVAPVPYGAVHITADAFLPSGPMGRRPRPGRAARARTRTRRVRHRRAARSGSTRTRRCSTRWRCRPTSSSPSRTRPGSTSPRRPPARNGSTRSRRRARRVLDAAPLDPPVLVHGDWRIENVNVAAGAVVAIYDWDSVCTEPEIFAVANAMVTHSVDWSRPGRRALPVERGDAQLPHRLRDRTRRDVRRPTGTASSRRAWCTTSPTVPGASTRSRSRRSTTPSKGSCAASASALLTDGLAALDD